MRKTYKKLLFKIFKYIKYSLICLRMKQRWMLISNIFFYLTKIIQTDSTPYGLLYDMSKIKLFRMVFIQ